MDDAHSLPFVWWKSNTVHTHAMFIDISRHHAVKHLQSCMLWLEDLHVWSITFSDYVFVYPPCWLAGHRDFLATSGPSYCMTFWVLFLQHIGQWLPGPYQYLLCVWVRDQKERGGKGGWRVSKVRGEKTDTIWQRLCLWWEAEISSVMFLECVFVCLWSVYLQNTLFYCGH